MPIVLAINLSFIACKNDASMSNMMESSFRLASNTLASSATQEKRQIRAILSEEVKQKYAAVGVSLDSIDADYVSTKKGLRRIQQIVLKKDFPPSAITDSVRWAGLLSKKFVENAAANYTQLIKGSAKIYGLRMEEIASLVQKMEIRKDSTFQLFIAPSKINSHSESLLLIAKWEMDIERFHLEMLSKLRDMTGGRSTHCLFGIFPLVIPLHNCIKEGDTFRAAIGLMPYDLPFTPEDFQLFVDGKPLEFTKGWYAEFEVPNVQKNKTVRIAGLVRDKMTGQMLPAFSDVRYEISVE